MEIDAISSFLAPITVGFIAAYLGSLLALSKFKKEKLWDERKEIYKEIIEAFEELSCWSEYQRASHCCESTIKANTKDSLIVNANYFGGSESKFYKDKDLKEAPQFCSSQLSI